MEININGIESLIQNVNSMKQFSGVVSLRQNNEIVFEKAYGYANRSSLVENTPDTRFGIASGCKIFTAVSICQLIEKGKIAFETKLKDCLNIGFPTFDENITIRHLLLHSSGIPDYFDEEIMTDYSQLWNSIPIYLIRRPKDFLPMFKDKNQEFYPGKRFKYSNAGYIVLGLIVEQHSGLSFKEYVESHVFEKCGMLDSGYFSLDNLPERTAYGYIEGDTKDTWKTNIYSIPIIGGPDGGAFTTAKNMQLFWECLFSDKLASGAMTQMILSSQIATGEPDRYYGYGIWINKKDNDVFKYSVMGGDPGVSFRSSVYPKQDTVLTVFGNKEFGGYAITKAFEEMLLNSQ